MTRRALSLVEMMIALVLFATLMVAVVETAISVRGFSGQHEDQIDLEQEGRTILNQVTTDLSNSGWFSSGGVTYPSITAPPDPLDPVLSFGNEVHFLRLRAVDPGSPSRGIAHLDFSAPISLMEDWKTPINTVPGLVCDEDFVNNGGTRLVTPVWEPVDTSAALTFDENYNPQNLRIYCYRVEPSPTGRGTLRRYFRDGTAGAWQEDTTLGELGRHIFSFVVEQPQAQRVRITLELRRDVPDRARAIRRFEVVAAMRSAY